MKKRIEKYKKIDKRYKSNLDGSIKRWSGVLDYYYSGVENKEEILKELSVTFPSEYDSEITLTDLEAEGMCPHHFLPTHYTATLTYKPQGSRVVGTSKAYMAFKAIVKQPLLMEDIFEEFLNEFIKRVDPEWVEFEMRGKYECNYKDDVDRDAEVVLRRAIKKD